MFLTDPIPLRGSSLRKLRQISIRNKSWYALLSWEQRRFIDAVIVVVDRVRSRLLLRVLEPLVRRLLEAAGGLKALVGSVSYGMIKVGRPMALRMSRIACFWGNRDAERWARDEGFVRYLTVVDMNNIPMFRVGDRL